MLQKEQTWNRFQYVFGNSLYCRVSATGDDHEESQDRWNRISKGNWKHFVSVSDYNINMTRK